MQNNDKSSNFDEQIKKIKKEVATNQKKRYKNSVSGQHKNISIDLLLSVVFFGILGYFIDIQLNTTPLLLIMFIIIGFLGGFYNLLKEVKRKG